MDQYVNNNIIILTQKERERDEPFPKLIEESCSLQGIHYNHGISGKRLQHFVDGGNAFQLYRYPL